MLSCVMLLKQEIGIVTKETMENTIVVEIIEARLGELGQAPEDAHGRGAPF